MAHKDLYHSSLYGGSNHFNQSVYLINQVEEEHEGETDYSRFSRKMAVNMGMMVDGYCFYIAEILLS